MIYFLQRKVVKKVMTKKEYEQACEIEKLKKELKQKDSKIKDLESQKKHY